jgi:hypothetical protein
MSPSGRQPRDTGPQATDRGGLTRRQFFGTAVAVGAAIVWTTEFPFSDAVIGQTIGPSAGPTGPTGPTGLGPVAGPAAAVPSGPSFTG